jgi:molybdopterin-binding protein
MNRIKAKVKSISTLKNLNIIEFDFYNEPLFMMSLEVDDIKLNSEMILGIKPTHIAIAKDFSVNLSFLNQIKVSVVNIEVGQLLTSIKGAVNGVILEAVITTKSYHRLSVDIGDGIVMLIPESELYIYKK